MLTSVKIYILLQICVINGQYYNPHYQQQHIAPAEPIKYQTNNYHNGYGVSRQFAHFSGPVSGAEHQITVPHHNHHGAAAGTSVDYVARPDYNFGYGVEDSKTGNKQTHKESRDGDVVRGEYTVLEPDGSMRIVKYTADPKNGFQAVVTRAGHAPDVHGSPAKNNPPPPPPPVHHNNYNHHNNDDDDEDGEDYD